MNLKALLLALTTVVALDRNLQDDNIIHPYKKIQEQMKKNQKSQNDIPQEVLDQFLPKKKKVQEEVQELEEIVTNESEIDQIKWMIGHLKKEKEAEERDESFAKLETKKKDQEAILKARKDRLKANQQHKVGQDTIDLISQLSSMPDNENDANDLETAMSQEDIMSAEEWQQYYDENLSVSGTDKISEEIAMLEEMEKELEAGQQIDEDAEKEILEEVFEEMESGDEKISIQQEIVEQESVTNSNFSTILLIFGLSALGMICILWTMVRRCKNNSAAIAAKEVQADFKQVQKTAEEIDDIEMTAANQSVDHF